MLSAGQNKVAAGNPKFEWEPIDMQAWLRAVEQQREEPKKEADPCQEAEKARQEHVALENMLRGGK